MKINYPTWKIRGSPTPAETLHVCEGCGNAVWSWPNVMELCHNPGCQGRKGGPNRMRKATPAETEEAKKHLKTII